ncbi:hypothetical protein EEB14_07575 [Rhodococcus sp. WS4]|nr:hypothetical protein EEB14_07575 [Rhodococcus sp. WS4]
MIQVCGHCGTLLAPLISVCSRCGSSQLAPIASTGIGSIISSRVVHREVDGCHGELVPVTIAIVALDDGPWVYSFVAEPLPPCATEPVRVRFVPNIAVDRLPVCQLCSDQSMSRIA